VEGGEENFAEMADDLIDGRWKGRKGRDEKKSMPRMGHKYKGSLK
jgi:hypothetical protein